MKPWLWVVLICLVAVALIVAVALTSGLVVIRWFLDRTPHQLDVLRTFTVLIGGGLVPVFGFILTWLARGIRHNTRTTVEQTSTHQWIDGKLYTRGVAETGEIIRGEISDLYNELPKVHGRRRLPTTEIATQAAEDSIYE